MNDRVTKLRELGMLMREHGLQLIVALVILIAGLFLTKWAVKTLKILLAKFIKNPATIAIVSNSVGVLMLGIVIVAAAGSTMRNTGSQSVNCRKKQNFGLMPNPLNLPIPR